eukprot:6194372-Pleurochrysis_carterae.AAC.2
MERLFSLSSVMRKIWCRAGLHAAIKNIRQGCKQLTNRSHCDAAHFCLEDAAQLDHCLGHLKSAIFTRLTAADSAWWFCARMLLGTS